VSWVWIQPTVLAVAACMPCSLMMLLMSPRGSRSCRTTVEPTVRQYYV
jgi:hypothetical protein